MQYVVIRQFQLIVSSLVYISRSSLFSPNKSPALSHYCPQFYSGLNYSFTVKIKGGTEQSSLSFRVIKCILVVASGWGIFGKNKMFFSVIIFMPGLVRYTFWSAQTSMLCIPVTLSQWGFCLSHQKVIKKESRNQKQVNGTKDMSVSHS